MALNWDQSDQKSPLYAPLSDADDRVQAAFERAENARFEFAAMAERFAREARALAKTHGLSLDMAGDIAPIFWEQFLDMFVLPSPEDAADRARSEEMK